VNRHLTEHSAGVAVQATRPVGVRLAPLWVVVVFSNLPVYIFTFILPALVPLYWLGALFVLTFLALSRVPPSERDYSPVFLAVLVCYAGICLIWYVVQGGGDIALLRQRLLSVAVCGASYLVFATNAAALHAARRALVVMVVMAVLVNAYDITHPFTLIPADSELSIVGRAAGFFINPNQAGAALVAAFTLSVGVIAPRWRPAYLVVVVIGVALTFSRAAILGLVLVSIPLAYRGRSLSWRQLAAAVIVIAGVSWITWLLVSAELQDRFHIDPDVALDRLFWVLDPSNRSDFSEWERITLLERGWEQFLASPFLGNGLGSTELWEARASTHNEYVMQASDFGVLGLFVLPAFVLAAVGTRGIWLSDAAVTGLFLLFWGFFSHNILSEYYLLLTVSLIAALSRRENVLCESEQGVRRARVA
jgi:O-antigen ligase